MEYQCHDCSKPIRVGDLYYHRRTDFTILCLVCFNQRKTQWLKLRDVRGKKENLLSDLRRGSWTASQLHTKYGSSYSKWIRDLKLKGHPIWRTRIGGAVIYHIQEDEYPGIRCRKCGRFFDTTPDTITAKKHLCPDCLASLGILGAVAKGPTGN